MILLAFCCTFQNTLRLFSKLALAGGWIFYDKGKYTDGWRYLEAAPASTEWKDKQWGSMKVQAGATGKGIGTGQANTRKIIGIQGTGSFYAAQLCDALVYGGYNDWFLPSREEFYLMDTNLQKFGVGDFNAKEFYWTSTENSGSLESLAWAYGFILPNKDQSYKAWPYRVRAARAF